MKVITKADAVSGAARKNTPGTSGVYVLVDPTTHVPMYVGSTSHAEHRLYAHLSSTGARRATARHRWVNSLKSRGLAPEMWVVQEFDVGPKQSAERLSAERFWIEVCQDLFGGAQANTTLTPVGHCNSKDSAGKKLHAEVATLRARVAELEAELAARCGFERERAARCGFGCNTAL